MGFGKFLFSRDFIKHLAIIILVFLVIVYGTFLSLKYYTHHGETISVPDLTGMTTEEVEQVTFKHNLRYQVNDSVFLDNAIPGSVISQHPNPEYRVKQKRMIYLTVASFSPERVRVPYVTDVSFREARSRLQNSGLKLGRVEYRPSEFPNLVLDQLYLGARITHDTLLPRGSAIDLVVSRGVSNERTEIPNLFGLSIGQARKQLYSLNLDIGALVYDDSFVGNEDTIGARIYKQLPKAVEGKMIGQGTLIDVWVTKYEEFFIEKDNETTENQLDDTEPYGGL